MRKFLTVLILVYLFTCIIPLASLIKADGIKSKSASPVTPFGCVYLT